MRTLGMLWLAAAMLTLGSGCSGCGDDEKPAPKKTADMNLPADMNMTADMGEDMPDNPDMTATPDMPSPPTEAQSWVVGKSVEGRPIIAEQYGTRGPVLFLLSAIHGNERSAVTFGERFRWHMQGGLAERLGMRVVYIGAANPDGVRAATRRNKNDIDLNRNFDTTNFQPGGPGGDTPLSEPETRALVAVTNAIDPTAVISVHCCVPTIDYDGPGQELAEAIAARTTFPAERLGSSNGSMGSWVGIELQKPIITLEFAPDERQEIELQLDQVVDGVIEGMRWVARNGAPQPDLDIPDALSAIMFTRYSADILAITPGRMPLRAESIGEDQDKPIVILSGLDELGDRRGPYFAEHLRRVLLENSTTSLPLIHMVTTGNPDGATFAVPSNAVGMDVGADFVADAGMTPEGRALRAWLESVNPKAIVVIDSAEEADRFEFGNANVTRAGQVSNSSISTSPTLGGRVAPALAMDGVPVLRVRVGTEFARGDTRNGTDPFVKPSRLSTPLLRLLKDLSWTIQ